MTNSKIASALTRFAVIQSAQTISESPDRSQRRSLRPRSDCGLKVNKCVASNAPSASETIQFILNRTWWFLCGSQLHLHRWRSFWILNNAYGIPFLSIRARRAYFPPQNYLLNCFRSGVRFLELQCNLAGGGWSRRMSVMNGEWVSEWWVSEWVVSGIVHETSNLIAVRHRVIDNKTNAD